MKDARNAKVVNVQKIQNTGGNAENGLGLLGALVYYVTQATSVWTFLTSLFKAFLWPAFVVFDLLRFIGG